MGDRECPLVAPADNSTSASRCCSGSRGGADGLIRSASADRLTREDGITGGQSISTCREEEDRRGNGGEINLAGQQENVKRLTFHRSSKSISREETGFTGGSDSPVRSQEQCS